MAKIGDIRDTARYTFWCYKLNLATYRFDNKITSLRPKTSWLVLSSDLPKIQQTQTSFFSATNLTIWNFFTSAAFRENDWQNMKQKVQDVFYYPYYQYINVSIVFFAPQNIDLDTTIMYLGWDTTIMYLGWKWTIW